ncbi:MAG: dihydrodipicolinate synthase family protein [Acidobacteria bacterium]|nr:MAG: dihydrodipicolinate synthase family protein [Acidobacteriota bacterium]
MAVWAHTGRGLHLSREQRVEVLGRWNEKVGAQKIIVAGVGGSPEKAEDFSSYVSSALDMAHDALDNGAHAFLVHPPRLPRCASDRNKLALEYHKQLATTRAPLVLFYLYEAAGGIAYSPDLLGQLLALPEVVGIKLATLDSVMTFQDIATLVTNKFPEKLLISGEDRFLGYSLTCGARAALVGMGAACTKLQHRLLRACFERRAEEFLSLSAAVDRLSQVLFIPPMEGYIRRMLWALVHLGVLAREAAHDPWGPDLPESEFVELGNTLRALGELPAK